jgi:glycosyltransferase involved in cell wall biosynthesis
MKVSIITICLNIHKTIERTLKSIAIQDYKNIEWIVVDGGSTDGTLNVINKYKHKIRYLISGKDNGLYDAMNKGIEKATGDIIILLNGGDEFTRGKIISDVVKKIQNVGLDNYDVFFGDNVSSNLRLKINRIIKHNAIGNFEVTKESMAKGWVPHNATVYTQKAFEKNGLFNTKNKIVSDWEWCVKAVFNDIKFCHIDLLIGVIYSGGISTTNKTQVKQEKEVVLSKYYEVVNA